MGGRIGRDDLRAVHERRLAIVRPRQADRLHVGLVGADWPRAALECAGFGVSEVEVPSGGHGIAERDGLTIAGPQDRDDELLRVRRQAGEVLRRENRRVEVDGGDERDLRGRQHGGLATLDPNEQLDPRIWPTRGSCRDPYVCSNRLRAAAYDCHVNAGRQAGPRNPARRGPASATERFRSRSRTAPASRETAVGGVTSAERTRSESRESGRGPRCQAAGRW